MIISSHCNYSSSNSIQTSGTISLSIQFLDSEGIPTMFTSSGTALQIQSDFNTTIPNYGGIDIIYGKPVVFRKIEYQVISGSSTRGTQTTNLNFSQSDCLDLPILSSISNGTTGTGTNMELMNYDLFRETTLIEIWISWLLIVVYTGYVILNSVKYGIFKN